MWYVKNPQGDIIYLKPNKSMIVGRKDSNDIVLKNDTSVSKLHATITVRPKVNFKHNEPSSTIFVKDTGSKYGTFVIDKDNKQRKLASGDHELTATDKVKFGLQNQIFTLHFISLIISTSTLNANEKTELRDIIDTLDGVILEKWKEYCTHLTVSRAGFTIQVAQALAFGTPIVKLEYWQAVLTNIKNNKELPDISNFIPAINEGLINRESISLKTNAQRKSLFKNIVFICFAESQYSFKDIIKYAGGTLKLFKEGVFDLKQLCSENFVLLQLPTDILQPSQAPVTLYDSIHHSLQKKKLRLIPDSEIFLAILYCSIEKYCNPKFDFKHLISSSERKVNVSSSKVLVEDTEEVVLNVPNIRAGIVNESLISSERQERQEMRNIRKKTLSLRSREAERKGNFGSEDSSREDALMIDETRCSIESDDNDSDINRSNFSEVFEDRENANRISGKQSTKRHCILNSKLQTSKVSERNIDKTASRAQSSNKNIDACFYSNPSTSKNASITKSRNFESMHGSSEDEEILPIKRPKNISGKFKSAEENRQKEIVPTTKTDIAKVSKSTNSANVKDVSSVASRLPKEEDMFSFVNEGPSKRKRNTRANHVDDLFELLEDPVNKNSHQEQNIFEKELNKIKKLPHKRRRSSLSSNNDSSDNEQLEIKTEKRDTDDEIDNMPLVQCTRESDSCVAEKCKSSVVSLLRADINLTLNTTLPDSKRFIKVYKSIPKQRIKLKNMYVWKTEEDSIKCQSDNEEKTSSEDDEADARFKRTEPLVTTKRRKIKF